MYVKKGNRFAALILAAGMLVTACSSTKPPSTQTEQTGIDSEGNHSAEGNGSEASDVIRQLHPLVCSNYRNYWNDSGELWLADVEWDEIEFEGEEAGQYLELAAAVKDTLSAEKDSLIRDAEDSLENAAEYAQNMGDYGGHYGFSGTVELNRSDSKVFSFTILGYQFTGGVHGMYGYSGYNYDSRSGKLLKTADIFTDTDKLVEAVKEALLSSYSSDSFFDSAGLADSIRDAIDGDRLNVVLTNRGPRVYFNPYELGNYAEGVFIANLYPELYPELVKAEYAKLPENWIVKLKSDTLLQVDIDGDKQPEDIRYSNRIEYEDDDSYARITGFDIYAGDEKLSMDAYVYDSNAYFVKNGDKSFLYIIYRSDNDYQGMYVINLTDKKPVNETDHFGINASIAIQNWEYDDSDPKVEKEVTCSYSLTDPQNMYLESRTDFLSTTLGVRLMHAGENGVPVPNEGWELYRIERFANDFTALKDVKGILLDEDGNEVGDYTISAGEKVHYVRTDNEKFGDVRTADGKLVRLYMNRENWPYTINGSALEDLFDGTLFAG